MEDSDGHIKVRKQITDAALFHHSVISKLWKKFLISQTVVQKFRAIYLKIISPADDQYIAVVVKLN